MKKKKKKKFRFLIIIFILLGGLSLLSNYSYHIKIKGDKNLKIKVYDNYQELGAQASFLFKDVSQKIKIDSNLDSSKVGNYKIVYQIEKIGITKKVVRHVQVIDTEKPVITLKGSEKTYLVINSNFQDPGYNVTDNYDQNLKDKVKIQGSVDSSTIGKYTLTYTVADSSDNVTTAFRTIEVVEKSPLDEAYPAINGYGNSIEGPIYIKGILIVNKTYSLPDTYNPGVDKTASAALEALQTAAGTEGYTISLISGFRSFEKQKSIYDNNLNTKGSSYTDYASARPGHSEHQTGLAFDVGKIANDYGETAAGKWLAANCYKFGFIIRYPKDKTNITQYQYEPWHIRYVGVDIATEIMQNDSTLEEYLGIN